MKRTGAMPPVGGSSSAAEASAEGAGAEEARSAAGGFPHTTRAEVADWRARGQPSPPTAADCRPASPPSADSRPTACCRCRRPLRTTPPTPITDTSDRRTAAPTRVRFGHERVRSGASRCAAVRFGVGPLQSRFRSVLVRVFWWRQC